MSTNTGAPSRYRVAFVSFEFEGNDFSAQISGRAQFGLYAEDQAVWQAIEDSPLAVTGGVRALQEHGSVDLVPILVAQGGSGGTVEPVFYRCTVDLILAALKDAAPLDGVYLALHGAMTSPGVPDAEGEILSQVREIVGQQVVIAVSLDLHAHVTARMVSASSIIVGYRNYPHDDAYNTGRRACVLLLDALEGKLVPVIKTVRLNMLVPVVGSSTLDECAPLAKLKAQALKMELEGIASISYFMSQPWLDDDSAGNVILAITNDEPDLAHRVALHFAHFLWNERESFELPLLTTEAAIDNARNSLSRPVILADTADSVGAGAAGDATFVLNQLLKQAPDLRCGLLLVDAEAARVANAAGVGATLTLSLGFSIDPKFGEPLSVEAKVARLSDGEFVYSAGPYAGTGGHMGKTALLQIGNTFVVVASQGTYEYADEQFRALDVDTSTLDIAVLKNGMNFRNLLRPDSDWFLIDSVGSSSANLGKLPWKNRSTPFWPRERDVELNLFFN